MIKPCPADPSACPCRVCFLFNHNQEYNRLWGGSGDVLPLPPSAQDLIQQSKTRLALPCIHRGQPLEESASCGCGGAVLTACALYGQCRPYGTATDAPVCTRCPDYAAP